MKRNNRFGIFAVSAAMAALLTVQPGLAGEHLGVNAAPAVAPAVIDVELAEGGRLFGQVVDTQGAPMAGSPVVLHTDGREVVKATTDANGRFEIVGLRGDTYHVSTEGGGGAYRMWAPRTSPPGAARGVSIAVSSDPVVRAQYGACGPCAPSGFWGFVSNPWVSAALITAAIAIPIAVSNDSGS